MVHSHPSLADRVLCIDTSRILMGGSSGILYQNCRSVQKFVKYCHHKTLLFQFLLLLNQVGVDNVGLYPHQVKNMEHNWHTCTPAQKIMVAVSNQLV